MAIWDGVEEFSVVAQTGSFTAAAQRLHVSTSHVSRQISALEQRLGVKLLARTTRSVRLTEVGADYLAQVDHLITALQDANQSVGGQDAALSGNIRVSAAGPFAETTLAPLLLDFATQHPQVTLDLDFNNRSIDLVAEGYDFALRYGVLRSSSLIARKLVDHRLACVASADYLHKYGTPQTPKDLADHSCLVANNDVWRFQDPKTDKPLDVRVSGRMRTNNVPLMLEGVRRSFGIAYSPITNVQTLLDEGEAVAILTPFEDRSRSHWIVYPDRHLMPRQVRAAIDHLISAFS